MLPHIDPGFFGESFAAKRARIHRRMNLFAVGHQRIPCQWIVMFPACQLTHASNAAVDSPQSRTVTLAPDHTLVVGRRYLASTLDERSVRIKQQLSIVERSTIALVDANGHHHARLAARLADRKRCWRRHRYGLLEQHEVLSDRLIGPLHEREIGIVGQNGFWKGRELHAPAAELEDFLDYSVCCSFAVVEDGADLHGSCLDSGHGYTLWLPVARLRPCAVTHGRGLNPLHHGVSGISA